MIGRDIQAVALLLVTATENATLKGDLPESLPDLVVLLHAGLVGAHMQMNIAYPSGPEVCEQLTFELPELINA